MVTHAEDQDGQFRERVCPEVWMSAGTWRRASGRRRSYGLGAAASKEGRQSEEKMRERDEQQARVTKAAQKQTFGIYEDWLQ